MAKEQTDDLHQFKEKTWIAVGIVAFVGIILMIVTATFNVMLLILAGALIALYFQGFSGLIYRKLHLSRNWSLQ